MENIDQLRAHGLFAAKVPRYTSYPPANHFQNGVGVRHQVDWLKSVASGSDVSIYLHIPFCKRLCWFCACRTQGTQTLRPVDAYVEIFLKEIATVRASLPQDVRMSRLHLGGGTPTILSSETMGVLLRAIFDAFETGRNFEFSVEVDPTEASDSLLETLADFGMTRASIGVQDFNPKVQQAIGRLQSIAQTRHVAQRLRALGVQSVNMDLLYGLPHQTKGRLQDTLRQVSAMRPDRLAIYGYAHVPWMSKRQVMIKSDDLPDAHARYDLAEIAKQHFLDAGYTAIGIDHFALETDSLALAAQSGALRRNFQGYTDDTGDTLIGLGASAISRFAQGYIQNAPSTSAYQERISGSGFAGHKGYVMEGHDQLVAQMIEELMCHFAVRTKALCRAFPAYVDLIHGMVEQLKRQFSDVFIQSNDGLLFVDDAKPLVRIIAHALDDFATTQIAHSAAI